MRWKPLSENERPNNIEAEQAVLGILLYDNDALHRLAPGFTLNDFYEPFHKRLFDHIRTTINRGALIDPALLSQRFAKDPAWKDLGGAEYIGDLVDRAPAAKNIGAYAEELAGLTIRRELLRSAEEIATAAIEEDTPQGALNFAQTQIRDISVHSNPMRPVSAGDAVDQVLHEMDSPGDHPAGVMTGLEPLDRHTGGFMPTEMIVLAGRPGMGKSAEAGVIAQNVAMAGMGALEISGEMSVAQMMRRHITSFAHARNAKLAPAYSDIRKRQIEFNQRELLGHAADEIRALPLQLLKRTHITLPNLRTIAMRQAAEWERLGIPFGIMIVDHGGLVKTGEKSRGRTEDQTEISGGLKALADDLGIPILVLLQLNRDVEKRDDKRPSLGDLRDSGCLAAGTKIYLPDTGEWVPIESLVGTTPTIAGAFEREIVAMPSLRVFPSGHKETFRVTTMGGRQITATACHKFLTKDGWRRLDELTPASLLAAPGRLPVHGRTGTMRVDEAALLGHLIGDGCVLPRHAIQYTTKDQDLAEIVMALATGIFGDTIAPRMAAERNQKTGASWLQVYLASSQRLTHGRRNPISSWFAAMGIDGLRSHEKRVPDLLYRQPPEVVAAFLRHLWATDGTIINRARPARGKGLHPTRAAPRNILNISLATSSRGLALGVRDLLLSLGINARVGNYTQGAKGRRQHPVTIAGLTAQRRFIEVVGIAGARKTAKVSQASALLEACGACRTYDGDIIWDAVREITPAGAADVFDISVPTIHNFVAEGLVVHNSWEQDADMVIGCYREAYYALKELEPKEGLTAQSRMAYAEWERRCRSPFIDNYLLKVREGEPGHVKLWADMRTNAILASEPETFGGFL